MNHGSRYSSHEKQAQQQQHQQQQRYKIPNSGVLISPRNYNQCYYSSIRSFFSSVLFIPTSIILLVIVFLLLYNSFNIFYVDIPTPLSLLNSTSSLPPILLQGRPSIALPSPSESESESISRAYQKHDTLKKRRRRRRRRIMRRKKVHVVAPTTPSKRFSRRVNDFFSSSSPPSSAQSPCNPRFFMTWISSLDSFSKREVVSMESLFRRHPKACLLMVSASMDSDEGLRILRPFIDRSLRVMAVAPDLEFLFKNTTAAAWFDQLKKGRVKPGAISLAQNLSNLLRLALLYKYGGIYMDTDFILLRPLLGLRNIIGAQNSDQKTGTWTRLNNALMIFDKRHPLLREFIDEFALTFDGNKWGHNGPYLVSRVVKRVLTTHPLSVNFTVLPPSAFYPVDWGRIGRLFQRWDRVDEMETKEDKIKRQSYGVHLWNRQTRILKVENGSVIARLMLDSCLFCNSTASAFEI